MQFWSIALKYKRFRRSIITSLKSAYFHELGHCIPLNNEYEAHLLEYDAYDSFSEIFIQREYEGFIPKENISKVIDLGANFGYFSLWLQSRNPRNELFTILIEPSPRCQRSLEQLVNQTLLKGRFKYLQKAIANPKLKSIDFFDRPYMASSVFESAQKDAKSQVSVLTKKDIKELLPAPYDLIKCDIEGSEWDFINHFSEVIKSTKYILLEWHSWHNGGGGCQQLEDCLKNLDYEIVKSSNPTDAIGRDGKVGLLLAKNLKATT